MPDGSSSRRRFPATSLALAGGVRGAETERGFLAPGDAGHEAARRAFNACVGLRAGMIAPCVTEAGITRHYRNYPDPRLQSIKARFDPADRSRHPQSIRPAAQ